MGVELSSKTRVTRSSWSREPPQGTVFLEVTKNSHRKPTFFAWKKWVLTNAHLTTDVRRPFSRVKIWFTLLASKTNPDLWFHSDQPKPLIPVKKSAKQILANSDFFNNYFVALKIETSAWMAKVRQVRCRDCDEGSEAPWRQKITAIVTHTHRRSVWSQLKNPQFFLSKFVFLKK